MLASLANNNYYLDILEIYAYSLFSVFFYHMWASYLQKALLYYRCTLVHYK